MDMDDAGSVMRTVKDSEISESMDGSRFDGSVS